MEFSSKTLIVIVAISTAIGCGRSAQDRDPMSSNLPRLNESSAATVTISTVAPRKLRVTVSNESRDKLLCFDSYFANSSVKIDYGRGDNLLFDFGNEHKLPVGQDADWIVLRHGQSFSWTLTLPDYFEPLENAKEIQFECGRRREVPLHIRSDRRKPEVIELQAQWVR